MELNLFSCTYCKNCSTEDGYDWKCFIDGTIVSDVILTKTCVHHDNVMGMQRAYDTTREIKRQMDEMCRRKADNYEVKDDK